MTKLPWLALLLIGCSKPTPYSETRMGFVRTALSAAEPSDTLILGDSVSESTWLDGVCGRTFNASVGGAFVKDVAALAPEAVRSIQPKRIVLEVGANNLWGGRTDPTFRRDYRALVKSLPAKLSLVGVPNNTEADRFVRSVAQKIGAAYVEPVRGNLTIDGVHPTTEGARVYRSRIAASC
jgi:lysophospholipase L1-like esterase